MLGEAALGLRLLISGMGHFRGSGVSRQLDAGQPRFRFAAVLPARHFGDISTVGYCSVQVKPESANRKVAAFQAVIAG